MSGWSELANNHKAFTYYAKLGLIALPLSGSSVDIRGISRSTAGLQVIKVDAQQGFTALGVIDHSADYETQGCYVCSEFGGCYQQCGYGVEMRRGAFVESTDSTYVYGISYAAVSVSDVASVSEPIRTVVLPEASTGDSGPWYGTNAVTEGGVSTTDAGSWPPVPQPGAVRDAGVAAQE